MNRVSILLVLLVSVLVAALISVSRAQPGPGPGPANTVGRYQLMSASETYIYAIDTQSGQVWGKARVDKDWKDHGNPAGQPPK
jgi:hypothetical protein